MRNLQTLIESIAAFYDYDIPYDNIDTRSIVIEAKLKEIFEHVKITAPGNYQKSFCYECKTKALKYDIYVNYRFSIYTGIVYDQTEKNNYQYKSYIDGDREIFGVVDTITKKENICFINKITNDVELGKLPFHRGNISNKVLAVFFDPA